MLSKFLLLSATLTTFFNLATFSQWWLHKSFVAHAHHEECSLIIRELVEKQIYIAGISFIALVLVYTIFIKGFYFRKENKNTGVLLFVQTGIIWNHIIFTIPDRWSPYRNVIENYTHEMCYPSIRVLVDEQFYQSRYVSLAFIFLNVIFLTKYFLDKRVVWKSVAPSAEG